MTTSKHARADHMPTATAAEHRLRIFAATRRPSAVSALKIETAYGEIKITGKLGQAHADLLDAICYCAEKKVELEDGRVKLLVDPAAVRRTAAISSGEHFDNLVIELCAAVLEIRKPSPLESIGHLVDDITPAKRHDGTPITRRNPLGGERKMWRVELGKTFCKLLGSDIWRSYNPTPIAKLRHGISQAIARHVLTHQHQPNGGWKLDTLITAVAGEDLSQQSMRDRRREVRADAAELAASNILVDGDRVRRVEPAPGSVEPAPGSVEPAPGAWSQRPALAVLSVPSGTSTAPA